MKRKSFKGGALTAPVPAAIVTVGDMERCGMLTVSWTGILSTVPPKTYVSIRPQRNSYSILKESGEFVVNLPSADMARVVDYIGIYTGKKVDKFEKCALTKIGSKCVGAPTVAECPIALECVVTEIIPMGSHDVFVADIVNVTAREELVDEDGKIRFDKANLLAYAHGEYFALGEKVGKFGFSTDKAHEKKSEKLPENKTVKAAEKKSEKVFKKSECGTKEREPFYLGAPRKRGTAASKSKNKDKGRPHGKRAKRTKEVK